MTNFKNFKHPYTINKKYATKAAYFCMEFGIDQALKIYSGGLGYLAGSHMRSAYELKQGVVGVGILWKYGYYDQNRNRDGYMEPHFIQKHYDFLEDTGIVIEMTINNNPVKVKAYYLAPEVFGTAPMFFLSTDVEGNDYLARTTTNHLYDANAETKIAQCMVLGIGGYKLLKALGYETNNYHLNEAHALSLAFEMYKDLGNIEEVRNKIVFTTHTPVEAGNEKHDIGLLKKLSFFAGLPLREVMDITGQYDGILNHTLAALRLSRMANGVSQMHGDVANQMWGGYDNICKIKAITNSQNAKYWADDELATALKSGKTDALANRKKAMKAKLFKIVADQTGKIFDPEALTIVWARRFAYYKRADLIVRDIERFEKIIKSTKKPVQMIWAGKPYPKDFGAIDTFNYLIALSRRYANCAVLTGYELELSKALKDGADVWLNTPRITREASGTSGMTAAMNGSVNFSTWDGWIPEFAKHGKNAYIVPAVDLSLPFDERDIIDRDNLMSVLEKEIIPTYYDKPKNWWKIVGQSMKDVLPFFDSDRMADEYYQLLYKSKPLPKKKKVAAKKKSSKIDTPLGKIQVDDLKIVEGIGPKIEKLLKEGGFHTWEKLSKAEIKKLQDILDAAGPRYRVHNPKTWAKQAELASEGKWNELKQWQDELDGGK